MAVFRNVYLLWLPIALLCLVLPTRSQFNAHQNYIRSALANQISSLEAEFHGAIDTSLDGYDHERVAIAIHQAREKRRAATLQARSAIFEEAELVKREVGDHIDTSLEGYDLNAIDVDDDEIKENSAVGKDEFDTGFADEDDILGHRHSARSSTPLKNYEPVQPDQDDSEDSALVDEDDWPADVDLGLEGYDVSYLTRRDIHEGGNNRYQDIDDEARKIVDDDINRLTAQAAVAAEAARAKAKRTAEGWSCDNCNAMHASS
ncbi:hypothetical protein CERZMDRAFT_116641 [Cercospora zeae-maydis SCOH1-5]|uniref:Uncharacterized protein n=1 Tax=Cercospora zeae-maydis SCOH1-5 TaxID=717836 RepID=A0A6A6FSB5_9PEZI|nr:hypothetical protein CERZMDRAFT_116641 [Cercospora zeae-maydis SCOH1-5]